MKLSPHTPLPVRNVLRFSVIVVVMAAAGWWLVTWKRVTPATSRDVSFALPPPPEPATNRSKLPAEVRSWLQEIEREKTPSAQTAAAARLAARLTPDEWPLLLAHLKRFSTIAVRAVLDAAVVRRWAEADPEGSAAWGLQHHDTLVAAASAAWLLKDATAATAWFNSLTPQDWQKSYLLQEEFYVTLARLDPEACFATMRAHCREPGFDLGWGESALAATAPDQVLEFAAHVGNAGLRRDLRAAVAREFGRRGMEEAVAWAVAQPDAGEMLGAVFEQFSTPLPQLLPIIGRLTPEQQKEVMEGGSWSSRNPFETFAALMNPPEGLTAGTARDLLKLTVDAMVRENPEEAVKRLSAEKGDHLETWIEVVAYTWSQRDPEAARAWLEQLPESPLRDRAMETHAQAAGPRYEGDKSTGSVERLLKNLPRPREYTFGDGVLNTLSKTERHDVWEQTLTLPADQQASAQANLITLQAAHAPAEAAAWLGEQLDSPQTTELASRLAAHWALDDAPAAARWATSLPEGDTKTWTLWNLARQWQRVDPAAARRWAAALPAAARAVAESAFVGQRPAR